MNKVSRIGQLRLSHSLFHWFLNDQRPVRAEKLVFSVKLQTFYLQKYPHLLEPKIPPFKYKCFTIFQFQVSPSLIHFPFCHNNIQTLIDITIFISSFLFFFFHAFSFLFFKYNWVFCIPLAYNFAHKWGAFASSWPITCLKDSTRVVTSDM